MVDVVTRPVYKFVPTRPEIQAMIRKAAMTSDYDKYDTLVVPEQEHS